MVVLALVGGVLGDSSSTPVVWGVPLTGAVIYGIYRVATSGAKAAKEQAPAVTRAVREWFQPAQTLPPTYAPSPAVEQRLAQLRPVVATGRPSQLEPALARAPFVFVSYKRTDAAAAEQLRASLERGGVRAWLDTKEIAAGDRWRIEVQEAIERCGAVVALMSGDQPSDIIEQELVWANRHDKPIFPVSLDHGLYFMLSTAQHVESTDGTVEPAFVTAVRNTIATRG